MLLVFLGFSGFLAFLLLRRAFVFKFFANPLGDFLGKWVHWALAVSGMGHHDFLHGSKKKGHSLGYEVRLRGYDAPGRTIEGCEKGLDYRRADVRRVGALRYEGSGLCRSGDSAGRQAVRGHANWTVCPSLEAARKHAGKS